jgi:hypothetical protein
MAARLPNAAHKGKTMKSLLLLSTAIATLAAAPALAQDGPAGSVGVAYTDTSLDTGMGDADLESWSLNGVTAMPAFGEWTVTLAADVTNTEFLGDDETEGAGSVGLSRMFGSDMRLGGFVAASDAGDDTAWTGGFRAQKYLANATLTGVVAYTDVDGVEIWTAGGDAAFYVTPSLRLNAGITYDSVDDVDVDAWTYGIGAEYDIRATPFSVTAGYARSDIGDLDLEVDSFNVGLRYSFGGDQQSRDRAGAGASGVGIGSLLGIL